MKSFMWGIIIGVFVATLLPLFAIQYWGRSGEPVVRRFAHSSPAGNDETTTVLTDQINLAIALTDTNLSSELGLKSVIMTIGGIEIGVAQTEQTRGSLGYWQPLALEEQTIDLVKTAKEQRLVDLSTSQLAAGLYHTIKINLAAITGRTESGQRVTLPLDSTNRTIEILTPFDWRFTSRATQLVIDLDLAGSIREENNRFEFVPQVRQLIENDTIRPI